MVGLALFVSGCPGGGGSGGTVSAPTAPTGVTASPGVRQTSISWNNVAGAKSYNVYWSTSQGVTTGSTKISGAGSPYHHDSLTSGTRYYYKVAAANDAGESSLSDEVSAVPHVTVAEAIADGIINIPGEQPTIQAGLDAARTGDTVRVDDGTYYENLVWPGVDGIKLQSVNGAERTIIDGRQLKSVIQISSSPITTTTVIEGFTIRNGNFKDYLQSGYVGPEYEGGGGINVWNTSPTIRNNIITQNVSKNHGGGINVCWMAFPIISNNYITNNSAAKNGGGIYCRNECNATGSMNTIKNNSSKWCGGGVYSSITSSFPQSGNTITNNHDYDCYSSSCDNFCHVTAQEYGGENGTTGNSACDSCLAGCSGLTSCCTGYGCLCADECTASCASGTHLYCTLWGDCFCVAN